MNLNMVSEFLDNLWFEKRGCYKKEYRLWTVSCCLHWVGSNRKFLFSSLFLQMYSDVRNLKLEHVPSSETPTGRFLTLFSVVHSEVSEIMSISEISKIL